MTVYIDTDYKCHTSNPNGEYKEIETDFFSGKIDEYIEGYRFVPAGYSWTREDGVVFDGLMIAPFRRYDELEKMQKPYEKISSELSAVTAERDALLEDLAAMVEEIYLSDLEIMA